MEFNFPQASLENALRLFELAKSFEPWPSAAIFAILVDSMIWYENGIKPVSNQYGIGMKLVWYWYGCEVLT